MNFLRHLYFTIKDKAIDLTDRLLHALDTMSPQVRRGLVIAVGVLVLAGLGYGVKTVFFKGKKVKTNAVELISVRVQKAKKEDFTDSYTVMGSIRGAVENELRFEIDGVLLSYNYREGDRIGKGKILCSLDPKDAFTKADFARSKYSSERSSYFSASQRLKVYEELFRMKAISESKLQEARFETQSAEARMKASLSELELAQSNLAKTNLLAPSSGLLAEILIKPGEYVTPQDVVAKFISGGDTNFEVDVPEKDVNKLKVGLKVKVNCDSYSNRDFFGTLTEIAPTVKEKTRTTTIKISIDNDNGALRSGMFGRGSIYLVELKDVMLVPTDSLITLGDSTSLVPLVKPDPKVPDEGTIEMRHVTAGQKLTTTTVINAGLGVDELVVIETQGQLSDGLRVKFTEVIGSDKSSGSSPSSPSEGQ